MQAYLPIFIFLIFSAGANSFLLRSPATARKHHNNKLKMAHILTAVEGKLVTVVHPCSVTSTVFLFLLSYIQSD